MLDCFDGLVGLNATCAGSDAFTDLQAQGIDETLIGQFLGPEDTVSSFVSAVERKARAIIHNDVLTRFADRIQPHTFVDRYAAGQPDADQELLSGTGIGGILVEIDQRKSNAVLRIGSLGLWADTTGTVTITIYDLEDGQAVATYDIDVTAGESRTDAVQIALPAYRKAKAYFITHDLPDFYRVDLFPGCGSCGFAGYHHGGVKISAGRMAPAAAMRKSNISSTSHTSGLMSVITVECDYAQLLCEIRNTLALPYALKMCEEIIRRGVYQANRLNTQRLDLDLLKERADRYGKEYAAAMTNVMSNARIPDDPFCFACKSNVRYAIVEP